jgi:hypothetical protein
MVLTKYTSPTAGDTPLASVCARASSGNSAPSTSAGGSIAQAATANCDSTSSSGVWPKRRTSVMNAAGSQGSSESDTRESRPSAAMPAAYATSGLRRRSTNARATSEPAPIPNRNAASMHANA